MALIKCSGCGHMVSDKGTKCPKCGTPIHKVEEATKPIEEKEKVIAEVENPKVEIPKVDKPIAESPKFDSPISESPKEEVETPIGEYEDEPQRQTWKKVCGFIIFIAIVIGGIYLYVDKQNKAQIEKETMLKAKADSAFVADSLARVAAAEQARQDSINAVEAIRQKFVRFADVYVDLSDSNKEHINTNLLEMLKNRGYELQKEEKSSDYNELYDKTISMTHYYLGLNMSYSGYWKATGSPCSGVEFFISDEPHAYAVIHFENSVDLEAFLADAEKAGFKKNEHKEWSRNSDYPYDFIEKIDDTTLECNSEYPH